MSHSFACQARLAPLLIVVLICGCASNGSRTEGDPLEPANRGVYKFNDALDRGVLKPTAKAYDKTAPGWLKSGIGNFFRNLQYPITIVNQLLQGKVKSAGQDTARFLINTTLGWGGVLDVASGARLPHHKEDFGQTLGVWGVPPGPYLMVPLIGPASLRDLPSRVADEFLVPFRWYDSGNERWFSLAVDLVDSRARLLPLDPALDRVYDRYGFIRDAYLQRRLYQVYDGNPPEELLDEEFEDPDPGADEPATEEPAPDQPMEGEPAAGEPAAAREPAGDAPEAGESVTP